MSPLPTLKANAPVRAMDEGVLDLLIRTTDLSHENIRPTARAARRVECPRSSGAPDSAPANFDPASHPIIARHFFGVEPLRPIDDVAGVVVADLKRLRQVEDLHRLGPRAIGEMLREADNGKDLDRALGTYERLTPDLLKALGGGHFPPFPIPEVPS